jgi:hypothetical protein
MPLFQVYVCPYCGATTEPVLGLPPSWFSVSMPQSITTAGAMTVEYFDTWNCVSVYAGEQAVIVEPPE